MSKANTITKILSRPKSTIPLTTPSSFTPPPPPPSYADGYHLEPLPHCDTVDLKSRVFHPVKSLLPKAYFLPREPIVFLHGIFGNSRMYSKQSQHVADLLQTPVISVDIRNHGDSPKALPMTYETFVHDIAKFIKDQNLGKINIAGFSLGAKIAMLYALKYPELVARTVVIDNSPVKQNDIQKFLTEYAEGLIKIIDQAKIRSSDNDWYEKANSVLSTVVKDPVGRNYLMATNLMREDPINPDGYVHLILPVKHFKNLIQEDVGDWPESFVKGAKFDGPTLFLKATLSPFIRKSHENVIKNYFPDSNVEKIQATHLLIDERPDLFVSKVTNWFKQNPIN